MTNISKKKIILFLARDCCGLKPRLEFLEENGYVCLTTDAFQEGQRKVRDLGVDLVILEEHLKDITGLEFCKRIKADESTSSVPLIVLTEKDDSEIRIKYYRLGADDCLLASVCGDELLAKVDVMTSRGVIDERERRGSRQNMAREITRIIEQEMIVPHFQPIYCLNPFHLLGLEVLSRPVGSEMFTDPNDLFKSAEKFELYDSLEMMCWKKATESVAQKTRSENLFFNCAPRLIEERKLDAFYGIFRKAQLPFNNIILEITERSSINEESVFSQRLSGYRQDGFSFAVDDVGKGYSSLESIISTRPEIIKIDQHIIRGIQNDPVKVSITKFIVAFCKESGIITVAEGVETEPEFSVVRALGVDAVQGYYLFKPVSDLNLREIKDVCVAYV